MLNVNEHKKFMSIAMVAVLSFYLLFPVTGYQKPEKAYGVAPAVAAGVVFATGAAAAGLYISGTSLASYNTNNADVYAAFADAALGVGGDFAQYVNEKGGIDNAMQSFVHDGKVSLDEMAQAGFFGALGAYISSALDDGTVIEGVDSTAGCDKNIQVGGLSVPFDTECSISNYTYNNNRANVLSQGYRPYYHWTLGRRHYEYYTKDATLTLSYVSGNQFNIKSTGLDNCVVMTGDTQMINYYSNGVNSTYYVSGGALLNGVAFIVDNEEVAPSNVDGSNVGVYDSSVTTDGVVNPSGYAEPLTPTDEMLQSGFASVDVIAADVAAINTTNSDIYQFLNGTLLGALSPLATIAANVQTIRDTITTFPEWIENISDVVTGFPDTLSGIADSITTLPQAVTDGIGGLIEGIPAWVQGIHDVVIGLPDAIGGVASGVVGGVTDWWESLLDWLGDTPLAQLIADIIAAVNDGVLSITDALAAIDAAIDSAVQGIVDGIVEGLQFPEFPTITIPPIFDLQPNDDAMEPDAHLQLFEGTLREKAPFAYMFAFADSMVLATNYSDEPKFKVSETFEFESWGFSVPVEVDCEPFLLFDLGGTTPAYLLRMCFSLTLCMGVLYASYRLALKAFGTGA